MQIRKTEASNISTLNDTALKQECNSVSTRVSQLALRYALGKKLRDYLGIFPNIGGGCLLNSQNFCKLTKCFFRCISRSEILRRKRAEIEVEKLPSVKVLESVS